MTSGANGADVLRNLSGVAAVATWHFGQAAVREGLAQLKSGKSALDAVECGIRVVELDPSESTVGFGGLPNAQGAVELDAAVMWGPGRRFGAVAALRGIAEAVSVARLVMERTNHCMLVGEGARRFAIAQGFKPRRMLTAKSRERWKEWLRRQQEALASKQGPVEHQKPLGGEPSHDTIGMVAVDRDGNVCAGTSTSGFAFKMPGRVGDSPLIGSGLYADNKIGGAVATGLGERILRYCMSFRVVDLIGEGLHPQDACEAVVRFMVEDDSTNLDEQEAVLALDLKGRVGAASTKPGFQVAVDCGGEVCLIDAPHWEQFAERL